jgi:hypothetical protein
MLRKSGSSQQRLAIRHGQFAGPTQRLLQSDDPQAIDVCEIAVPTNQYRAESERRSGHPEVVFVQRGAALLASQLYGRVNVARPFWDCLAVHGIQELATGLFQLCAAPASWKSCNPKPYFASNDRTGNHAITPVQPGHPVLDLWRGSHQIANRVCVEEVGHSSGPPSNALDRALAAARQQSRPPDHRPRRGLDEVVSQLLATPPQVKSLGCRASADRPLPPAPRFSAAQRLFPPSHVRGHPGFGSSSYPRYHSLNIGRASHRAHRAPGRAQRAQHQPGLRRAARGTPGRHTAAGSVRSACRTCGRVLVRFSGTEPLARVMVEGPDLAFAR